MTRTAIRHPLSAFAVVALVCAFMSNPVWGSPARQNLRRARAELGLREHPSSGL
jgi:uncharacterized membrane protein